MAINNDYHEDRPVKRCEICNNELASDNCCLYCLEQYRRVGYDIPEPLDHNNITFQRWQEIQLIKKRGEAAGKTPHQINVEVYEYAYRVCYPNASGPSPFLDICDIPTATYGGCIGSDGYFKPCSNCGKSTMESLCCDGCTSAYESARFRGDIPAPLTQRIFTAAHWATIYQIELGSKDKPREQIDQLVSTYATYAVEQLKAQVYNSPAPDVPESIAKFITKTDPPTPAPPKIQAPTHKSTQTPPARPTQSPTQAPWIIRKYHELMRYYKNYSCYICGKPYWTKRAANKCCQEAKRTTPPPKNHNPYGRVSTLPHAYMQSGSGDICPICKGARKINGLWCDYCQGRGTLRLQ